MNETLSVLCFCRQDFFAKQNCHYFAFELVCQCRINRVWKTKWTSIGGTGQDIVLMGRKVRALLRKFPYVFFLDTGVHRGSGYEVMTLLCFFVLPISEKWAYCPPWGRAFTRPLVLHSGLL